MRRIGYWMLGIFVVSLSGCQITQKGEGTTGESGAPAKAPPTEAEIKALVANLKDSNKQTVAAIDLEAIGGPAVPAVAEHCGNVMVAYETAKPKSMERTGHMLDTMQCLKLLREMGPAGIAVLRKWDKELPKNASARTFVSAELKKVP